MKHFITLIAFLTFTINSHSQTDPSFEDIISISSISSANISPNGEHVLFSKSETDWENNKYDSELWLSKHGSAPFQLTNNRKGSSNSGKWSPNGKWIAFMSDRDEKSQLHVIRVAGGEAFKITDTETSISDFEWSPNGTQIAFIQSEDRSDNTDKRKKKFGGYAIEDQEFGMNQLWIMDFNESDLDLKPTPSQLKDSALMAMKKPKQLMKEAEFSINNFRWSPDGSKIAFGHQPNPLRNSFFKSDISVYDLKSKTYKTLVSNKSNDGLASWSPDGKAILYQTALNDSTSNYYKRARIYRIDLDGSNNRELAKNFDEQLNSLQWTKNGIFALAFQKTVRELVKINPENGDWELVTDNVKRIYNYSISSRGDKIAMVGVNDDDIAELYYGDFPIDNLKRLTNSTEQIDNWKVADSEVINWKSKDGTIIEGVLYKPADYNPDKKYPLLVIIHGGPTGISLPNPVPSYVYPYVQWLNKGALILSPNYRGSAGYGEDFRALNVKNLGVGDAWDVISGVEHLEEKGMIDADKVGAMGWSQGGYISAFLTTNSNKFKAISVGAGISNWMTYYVNTDIHPFTRQYLKATPWSDKEIYEKTSPMTNINNATTPTLIQHGEFDKRVPTPNAYELFQGLQDVGVETELIIYKGFGHGINKPKERLAAMWHNWQWFGKYLWGEDIELPMD